MCIEGYRIQKKDSSEMMMRVDDILPPYMETQYKNRISYMYFSRIRITGIRKNVFNGIRILLRIPSRMSSTQTLICIRKHFMLTFIIKHQQRRNFNPDCISKEIMPF